MHTPGPWNIWGHLEGGGIPIGAGFEGHAIATVFESGHDGDANAHLIVAAPDLLKALREIRGQILLGDAIDIANRAIDKVYPPELQWYEGEADAGLP